jgi:hypothetical protein
MTTQTPPENTTPAPATEHHDADFWRRSTESDPDFWRRSNEGDPNFWRRSGDLWSR